MTWNKKSDPSPKNRTARLHISDAVAWSVLILDVIASIWIWNAVQKTVAEDAHTRFHFRTEQTRTAVAERLLAYEQILRGGMALFETSALNVDRKKWRTYVENLKIGETYPGLQGVGFSLRIPPQEKDEHIRNVRAEGFPGYDIYPEGEREEYTSIVYLEPFDKRNRRAFGYDMFSEPVRRKAMVQARDTGKPSVSGKVILVQETEEDVQNGFLMYIPLYKPGLPLETPGERRAALYGYVYSPFRIKDLMRGILGQTTPPDIDFEIYDGLTLDENSFMFDNEGTPSWKADQERRPSRFNAVKKLDFNGHVWSLAFRSLPPFEAMMGSRRPILVLLIGLFVSLLYFGVVHVAITSRKRVETLAENIFAASRESEERFRKIFEESPVGVATVGLDYRFVKVNQAFCEMLGYSYEEFAGKTFVDITHPGDVDADVHLAQRLERGEIPYYRMEKRYIKKDGAILWARLNGSVLRDERNAPMYFIAMVEDISEIMEYRGHLEELVKRRASELFQVNEKLQVEIEERKKNEESLANAQKLLLHAEKLSALGKLAGSIAHEFNNPIYGVRNVLEQTGEVKDLDGEHKNLLKLAVKECDRMAGLIRQLQFFYRPSMESHAFLDVNRLVGEVAALAHAKLKAREIVLEKRFTEGLPRIKAIEDQIKQVVLNLVQNAEEAIGEKGGKITLTTDTADGCVRISVQDTGIGIPPNQMESIFDPFFTTKPAVKGTGLGLSVSYGIVKNHRGDIQALSAPGEGSTFIVTLPPREDRLGE
ncbi:MAG: CHASE domain-containing protein [Nitrospinae bacterium]|nr:CHASE domain-containing protein [Nitrospinota bacterium]